MSEKHIVKPRVCKVCKIEMPLTAKQMREHFAEHTADEQLNALKSE